MQTCFHTETKNNVPIVLIKQGDFPDWLIKQPSETQRWLSSTQFRAEAGNVSVIPDANGHIARVVCCMADQNHFWCVGHLPMHLPEGTYQLDVDGEDISSYAMAWGLGAYQFTRYKPLLRQPARLFLPFPTAQSIISIVDAIYLVRDWINTPTEDMGPAQFAHAMQLLAKKYEATFTQIIGDDLLKQNYPCIHIVGRASDDAPRLLDMRWGNPHHPKVTLVGKGVCFDSGGLDLKSSSHMLLMKKDMAGGAHAVGLARLIMDAKLPVCLRVLVPVVENVISGSAYRPGDVIKSRKGITIEIGNTDAEGRVILADALTEAVSEKPVLLIDLTTLTGAARIALGTELPAVFSNDDALALELIKHGEKVNDPLWHLPLFSAYREFLNSTVADINNSGSEPYAGAITAALFLKEFVPDDVPWLHFDMMAWNLRAKPGRPQGGEAMGLRALFAYLSARFNPTS